MIFPAALLQWNVKCQLSQLRSTSLALQYTTNVHHGFQGNISPELVNYSYITYIWYIYIAAIITAIFTIWLNKWDTHCKWWIYHDISVTYNLHHLYIVLMLKTARHGEFPMLPAGTSGDGTTRPPAGQGSQMRYISHGDVWGKKPGETSSYTSYDLGYLGCHGFDS